MVAAILAVAIAFAGYANNLICAHYSLESARAFLRFNSESVIEGIGQLMMSRNNPAIKELIVEISQDSTVYGDVRLVSHYSGEVVASRFDNAGLKLELKDRECAVCHDQEDLGGADAQIVDAVIDLPERDRILSVMAPIANEPRCRSADCHAHAKASPILGFLNADYSLQRMDAMADDRRMLIIAVVFISLLVGVAALWFMLTRLLARPINEFIEGTKRIGANQLDFRFARKRDDEIGVLEESFNSMTARLQTHQAELHDAMCYLEGIVENSADIIITVTPDGLIETFNRGAEETLGYGRTEVIGERIEMLFADPRERDVAIARLKDVDNVKNYETRFVAKDGQVRSVLLTLSRLRDRAGNSIGTFGISKDVTREKKLQHDLIQSQKFAAIGQAVTGIQHAIKNLLGYLKGGGYMVRTGMAKDNRQHIEEGWQMVEEGIERISSLAHNMLNYAKEWTPRLERVDLNDLVETLCERNRQPAAERGVTLHCEIPDGLPPVLCDPKLIHMAVTDLLSNAIDACTWKGYPSDERPQVVLKNSLLGDGKSFVIEVRDNGCGMNEEIRRNVFTPFFSTKDVRGTGLGLALTARIISVHAGTIWVESEPEQGSTFRFHLPMDGPRKRETVDGQAGSYH